MSQESHLEVERSYSVLGGILSYLIPGLGQIVQGRVGKGLLFMVCLLGLFHVGQAMGNWQNVYLPKDDNGPRGGFNLVRSIVSQRWHFGGQVWIGIAAWPAIWQYFGGPMPAAESNPFLHNFQKQPANENVLNEFLVNSDKTPDLGWIYTVIAGMLNVLVIYDAFAGPAYGRAIPKTATPPEGAVTK